jgi:hypothetical protein
MTDNLRLVAMTFPQRWTPGTATLEFNAILIPAVSPVDDPVLTGGTVKFADHVPGLQAVIIPSLASVPSRGDPTAIRIAPTIVEPQPSVPTRPSYQKVRARAGNLSLTVTGTGALTSPSGSTIRKALPQSYLDATGATPGQGDSVHDFSCAVREQPVFPPGPKPASIGWGPVISYALRQPKLATALGLRYAMTVQLPEASLLSSGGWLFLELDATDPWAAGQTPGGQVRLFAARLPDLTSARQLFAALTFPVDATGAIDDSSFSVAEAYDDGFAQVVHVNQPQGNDAVTGQSSITAATDTGVQIGWDDEQVLAWHVGQIQIMNDRLSGAGLVAQTPLGVSGYRIDVADVTSGPAQPDWHSLVRASTTLPDGFGNFDGELAVEPTAVRPQGPAGPPADAWLPLYFANWRGGSLVAPDAVLPAMMGGYQVTATADPVGVLLSYGRAYAFRVRLADLSSGGASGADQPVNTHPADVASIDFRRAVPPKKPGVQLNFSPDKPAGGYGSWPPTAYLTPEPESLTITRPLLGYPEVLYTGLGDTDAHRGQIIEYLASIANPGSGIVAGLPDPDAQTLEIAVEARTPAHDVAGDGVLSAPFRQLYTTTREFPALPAGPIPADPGLTLDLAYVDAPSIVDWSPAQPPDGPLVIPRARDVRLTLRAITRDDPAYFSPAASPGLPATIVLRAELRQEPALLIGPIDGSPPLQAFLFQRPAGIPAPPAAAQLGQQLNLAVDGLTLSAPPGQRVVFGASKAVRCSLPGDNSALTFGSDGELLRQWLVALVLDLERDWTWDGLADADAITVQRDGVSVGTVTVKATLGAAAVADAANWDRRRTRIVFFDGVDPHETTASGFPEALPHTWTAQASLNTGTGAVVGSTGQPTLVAGAPSPPSEPDLNGVPQALTLPIAVAPAQIPDIASVGLALSPFSPGAGYASTAPRQQGLWIELTAPVANQAGDALFARILGHGADPLLYTATPSTDQPDEPVLVLDPELMRVITPGQSDDRAGLTAMTQLEQAVDSGVHFLLPLPPGLDPSDPELFGFYAYELRIGHAGNPQDQRWWSTAQARFGRPLRVNGVQHPAPALACSAGRVIKPATLITQPVNDVLATATYATPVLGGQPLARPTDQPTTELCFLLYAQVVQADAASNRNVLLLQQLGTFASPRLGGAGVLPTSTQRLTQRDRLGYAIFTEKAVQAQLTLLGLPVNLPLSVLAVELLPQGVGSDLPPGVAEPSAGAAPSAAAQTADPLRLSSRPRRILRTSPLVPVAPEC